MKKTIALFLVLALFALTGCERAGEKNERTVDTARSFTQYYKLVSAAETEDTIYFLGLYNTYIKYVDKATGISGPLCGKAECKHNDENCNAYTTGAECLSVYNDRLYWLDRDPDEPFTNYAILSASLDGTDRRVELSFDKKLGGPSTEGWCQYIIDDGYFYYGAVRREVENGEAHHYLYVRAFPLDSDEESIEILHEKRKYDRGPEDLILQIYGDDLYILTIEPSEVGQDTRIRRWNTQSRELETLYEDIDGEFLGLSSSLWVTDECVYYNSDRFSRIYKYDLETGECGPAFDKDGRWIADNMFSIYELTNYHDGTYDFHVSISDFNGDTMVDDTYPLEFEYPYYNDGSSQLLGRDEAYAYYGFYSHPRADTGYDGNYTAIIKVAIDGSGAEALCETVGT